jgi:hypothetical protein
MKPKRSSLHFSPRPTTRSHVALWTVITWSWLAVHAADCDLNGVEDAADIEAGTSQDCNSNGVPDACDIVPLTFGTVGDPVTFAGEPQGLELGDLDGDGHRDLTIGTDAGVSIFFRRGDGEFSPGPVLEIAELAAVEAADLDADGDLDLVTASAEALQVYPNDGSGVLDAALQVVSVPGTSRLLVVDIDLDSAPDLVTLNPSQGTVTWHRNLEEGNLGEGGFGEARTFEVAEPLGNTSFVRLFLEVADFDGDGDVDLAVAGGREFSVSILANSSGDFTVVHSFRVGRPLGAFTVGDLNGDGRPELLVTPARGATTVWLNQLHEPEPGGGFAETNPLALDFDTLTLADIDGDATLDLLLGVRDGAGTTIRILRGRGLSGLGDGSFLSPQNVAAEGTLLRVDDLSGDGRADLAVATAGQAAVLVQGERAGLVLEAAIYPTMDWAHFVDVGHLNRDEFLDVVTSNADLASFAVLLNLGDGTLGEFRLSRPGGSLPAGVAVDLNIDGVDDLVLRATGGAGRDRGFWVLLNLGEGTFGEPAFVPSAAGGGGGGGVDSQFLGKADVDGDGRVDVLAPGLRNTTFISVLFNGGDGGFDQERVLDVGRGPWSVAAGDLDADGDLDLLTPNGLTSDLSILLQETPREFAAQASVPVAEGPRFVTLGDFNGDGHLDVVTAGARRDESVNVFLGRGDGTIETAPLRTDLGRAAIALTASDLDQDGFLDLITTDQQAVKSISVLLGRGDGTFSRPQRFGSGNEPRFSVAADMDNDGDVDIVTCHRGQSGTPDVFVLLNQAAAPVPRQPFLTTICTPVDFELVSVPEASPPSERRTKYVLPAREDATLLSPLYPNVARFAEEVAFLREVFPERFSALSQDAFADLALRRDSRDYFAGSIRRLLLDDGSLAYGFDVSTDPVAPGELLSLAETREVLARLRESFRLEPLVYFPTTPAARAAANTWEGPDFPVVITEEPGQPPVPGNPTFTLEIPEDTVLCGVFGVGGADRGVRDELALKCRVRLRPGNLRLPTDNDTFSAELFEEVLFGPDAVAAEPEASGSFRVGRIPGPPGPNSATTFRFTYSQPFALPDGRRLEIEVVTPLQFRARGDEPLVEGQILPANFFVVLKGGEPLQATVDGVPLVRFGSCTYDSLPVFEIEAELAATAQAAGGVLRLWERFEEADSEIDTAPASLVRAELSLGGEERVVTGYFELVYSSLRHNRAVDYLVVLDPPVNLEGLGAIHVVELGAPEAFPALSREASAAYLGPDFEILATPMVTRFTRTAASDGLFVRGDTGDDGSLDVADAIVILRYLFEREELPCGSAADANDDGRINIVDAIAVVAVLFGERETLPEPFPNCGGDPSQDDLSCRSVPSCP